MKNPYRKGICGSCGKRAEVRADLDENGNRMYWGPKGGLLTICKDCEMKEK